MNTYYKGIRTSSININSLRVQDSINGAHFFMTTDIELAKNYGNNVLAITIEEEFDRSRTRTLMNEDGTIGITEVLFDTMGLATLLREAWTITINGMDV